MNFENINKKILLIKKNLQRKAKDFKKIKEIFINSIIDEFGNDSVVNYIEEIYLKNDRILVVQTKSKTLTNELLLKKNSIEKLLNKKLKRGVKILVK